jgi:O-antigen/teichoic acid export membrane protein
MPSVKQETFRGVKWSAFEKFAVQGIQFFIGIILARLLSPSDYGVIGMHGIFLAVSQTFIDSGFSSALIKKIDRTEDDYCTAFYFNIAIAVVCYSILFAIAPWVGDFFHTPILCPVLRIQSLSLIINSLMAVQITKLTIDINFKALSIRSILSVVVSGVIAIILAFIGWGVWALVAQSLIACVINLIFIWIYCKWIPRRPFSKKSFHDLFSYGSKILASGLINTIYSNLTTLVIGRKFTATDLGEYNRGTSIPALPVNNLNNALQRVLFPILSRFQNDTEQLITYYRKYIRAVSMALFFICCLIAAIGRPLVLFLLTSKWESCIIYLQIFAFAIMFDHLSIINHTLLLAVGRSDLFLKLELIKKPVYIAILFAAIPFGVLGICISKIISNQAAIIMNTYYTGKLFKFGYLAQMKDFSPYLLYSILACLPAYLFTLLELSPLVSLLFGCLSAPFLYWLMLRQNPYMIEIVNIVKNKFNGLIRK